MASAIQQRPLRGSRISTFYPVKNLPSLSSLDSAFQLQEYISLLIRLDVHDVETIVSIPGKREKDGEGGKPESDDEKERKNSEVVVDEACWIYEQLRRLAQDLTHPLITMLQQECNRASCPEMKAGEWLYLCVAHGEDGAREQCCAIDYILHTLDSATALLNSPRAFPSRLSIPQTSHRHFSSLARRLGRIFAHAYFHHREAFEQAEAESSLYARFLTLTSKFDLVPVEFLVIPSRINLHDGRGDIRRDLDVQPPRLHAAAIDPQGERNRDRRQSQDTLGLEWEHIPQANAGRSPPGLGHEPGRDSPRRFGRNRTDTMVFSEAAGVVEELSKSNGEYRLQPVEVMQSSHEGLDEQPPESTASDYTEQILNAPEIPSILDEDGHLAPYEVQQDPIERVVQVERPSSPTSTSVEPTFPVVDSSPNQEAPTPLEAVSVAHPGDDAENQESPQETEHLTKEEKESRSPDVPSDADISGQHEQVETKEADDFVAVDLTKEEPEAEVEVEKKEEESVNVPPASPKVVEQVTLPDAEPSEGTKEEEVTLPDVEPSEGIKEDEPTPDTEKQEGEDVEPVSEEPSTSTSEEADSSTTVDLSQERVVEEAKAEEVKVDSEGA